MVAFGSPMSMWRIARGVGILLLATVSIGGAIMYFWSNQSKDVVNPLPSPIIPQEAPASQAKDDPFAEARQRMVDQQFRARDITDPKVLGVMGRVAREQFVPMPMRRQAYRDHPLPIGQGQTISQPYIVALMTQLARPTPQSRALEVGVGSGYQAAILAEVCQEVYGVEILQTLADSASERLAAMGYKNVSIRCGDGYRGWPEHAPFDVILVTAAPDHVPPALVDQLAPGGRLVIPVGRGFQELLLIEKRSDGVVNRQSVAPVQFVPMTGEAESEWK